MKKATKSILDTLYGNLKDSDGYCCFEILEPFINANRSIELSNDQIIELLINLFSLNAIESYTREEQENKDIWISSEPTAMNALNLWYRISATGRDIFISGH